MSFSGALTSPPVIAVLLAAALQVQATALLVAQTVRTHPGVRASQGVAVDGRFLYGVSNSSLVRIDKRSGKVLARWRGEPGRYPHLNSCEVVGAELVCAGSNFPATPMTSRVEVFDALTLSPKRSVVLADAPGSMTWLDAREGGWWAGFANYDGFGGQAGRDHRASAVVQYDAAFRPLAQWRFPDAVLARMAPNGPSGGGYGEDGLLYVTGHDRRELYALRAPPGGGELVLVATVAIPVPGQAIAWDRNEARMLYGVDRATGAVVAMRVPPVAR